MPKPDPDYAVAYTVCGFILGVLASAVLIHYGRLSAPPAPSILSPVPSEIHPD